jgi:hypothetical protein
VLLNQVCNQRLGCLTIIEIRLKIANAAGNGKLIL